MFVCVRAKFYSHCYILRARSHQPGPVLLLLHAVTHERIFVVRLESPFGRIRLEKSLLKTRSKATKCVYRDKFSRSEVNGIAGVHKYGVNL